MTGSGVHIPTLETERLILRAPRLADFEAWAEYFASDRSRHEGGPLPRVEAYRRWAADVACWTLRGYGAFGVDRRDGGGYVGEVGIYEPEGFPEPELGWFVLPSCEGKGFAAEAARAVIRWARASFGWTRLVSIIDPANARSIALALRLGGTVEPGARGVDPGDVVIRHDLRRGMA
jgi:RimJ/RimL family protein N-acetyltransferase